MKNTLLFFLGLVLFPGHFLFSCASYQMRHLPLPLDEVVREEGKIVWGRTHFPLSSVKRANKKQSQEVGHLMKAICQRRPSTIIRRYKVNSRALELTVKYPKKTDVMVIEFKCRK